MAKIKDVPTRSEVNEKIDISRKEMDEKENDLDKIATDVETVRQTLESLDFGGTAEGAEELEGSIEGAEDVTTDVFDRQDSTLEKIQEDNQEFEGELSERKGTSESDMGKVSEAGARIETNETISELEKAKEAISRDIEFLFEQIDQASDARKKSEDIQERHNARVHTGKGRS